MSLSLLVSTIGLSIATIAIVILFLRKNESKSKSMSDQDTAEKDSNNVDRPVLYLNIVIHDASEAVKAKVKEKIEESNLPKPIKTIAAKHGARIASKNVSSSTVAEKMASKLCKKVPKKMREKGLKAEITEVFREGPYVVLQLQVVHVDMIILEKAMQDRNSDSVATSSKEETGSTADDDSSDEDSLGSSASSGPANTITGALLQWTYSMIGAKYQEKLESGFLPRKIQEKLEMGMKDMLSTKFAEKKLHAEAVIMKEAQQARFFYSKLKEVREGEEKGERKGMMKKLKEKMKDKSSSLTEEDSSEED